MKRILLVVAMLIAVPAFAFGQTNGKNAGKKGGDEQGVRQAIDELVVALRNNDAAALDRLYADGYVFVGDTGALMTKAERVAAFRSGALKYESISHEVASIRLFGDTAVAIVRFTTKVAPGVKISDGKFVTTATYAKTKGRWQIVAAQSARVGDQ
jgi:ketosteroid isomerase-like protein